MENIRKIKLFEAIEWESYDCVFYSDRLGLCRDLDFIKIVQVYTTEWINAGVIYYKHKIDGAYQYYNLSYLERAKIPNVFSISLYRAERKTSGYGYNYTAYKTQINSVKVKFGDELIIFTKESIHSNDYDIWSIPDRNYQLQKVNLSLLRENDLVCRQDRTYRTYKIVKAFEPNPEGKLFRAVSLVDETEVDILENSSDVYQVPYWEYQNELSQFDEMINESALRPYVDNNVVFWLSIEEASQYIVSLYTLSKRNKLYHLQSQYVDRNKHYLVLDKELEGKVIVRVSAENREGKIIAQSRGINGNGEPRFWIER